MTKPFEALTFAQVASFPRPGTVVPARLGFTPDGHAVTYLYSEEGSLVRSLWRFDIATGDKGVLAGPPPASTNEAALSREEELRRERARLRELGVTDYQFASKSEQQVLLVPGGGKLWVSIGDAEVAEVPGSEGAIDPRLSPDGAMIAFVRDGELWVLPTAGGEARQLTSGAETGITNGLAEFIAQEELDRDRGFWWSPDGARIAFIRADSRHIKDYTIVHQGKATVENEPHRYPFAGEPNAIVQLGVVDLATVDTTWVDLGDDTDFYIARVGWRPDGVLSTQLLSRDQRTLRLLTFDTNGAATLLLEEHQEPWLNLQGETAFLESGGFLWLSERSGCAHLYRYDAGGFECTQLTSGDWMITHIARVDEPAGLVYFVATKESPLERHLYSVPIAGGEITRLTSEPGYHGVSVAKFGGRFIDSWSTREHGPKIAIRNAGGAPQTVLFENEGASAGELGLAPPETMTFAAADGSTMYGMVYKPAAMETRRKYPLVVSVYGGPHAQRAVDDWSLTVDLRAQYLAQQGFIVLKVDNRGSANRGLAFEAALADRMGTVEVDDQVAAVGAMAKFPWVDTSRVGIYGWSYGGYMTCMAMMRAPEVFKVGVAGAPVTDWDGYDTGYTERYMGTPQSNPEGYKDSSVLTHVSKLRGKLLLVHGMVDENVQFRHTARLIVALTEANKDYDLLIFPEERHMPRDARGLEYQERRVLEYFQREL
ncbi:MAG: S9 family peptidase [Tepidiformaceae bacterium]